MASLQTIEIPTNKISPQMCAVLRIITADSQLSDAAFRHINILDDSIDWEPILAIDMGTGFRAAAEFAFAVWTDRLEPGSQIFEKALSMSPELQRACLKALSMRWGL